MIEHGIEYVNEHGYDTLSLRKLATECEVSHAAVYKHFASKEDLILAMKVHVKSVFSIQLAKAVEDYKEEATEEILYALASAYIHLFIEHPAYFNFIYGAGDICIDFDDPKMKSDYKPFEIFRDISKKHLKAFGVREDEQVQIVIGMWAIVHGITEIAIMQGTKYSGDWAKMACNILKQNYHIPGETML